MNRSELPKRLGRPPKPVPEAAPKMRRRPRPKPLFTVDTLDVFAADKAMLIASIELARDPNASARERAEALKQYGALRAKLPPPDETTASGTFIESLREMLAERRETPEVAPGQANGLTNGSAPRP